MSQHPQTIQIYLPKGNPRGLRIAEIINRTVRLFEVPRPLHGLRSAAFRRTDLGA